MKARDKLSWTARSLFSVSLTLVGCGTRVVAFDRDAFVAPDGPSADVVSTPSGPTDFVVREVRTEIGCGVGEWCWESPAPEGEAVFASASFGDDDLWFFGGGGMAHRFDGTRWTRVRTGTRATLVQASGVAPNDIWVVGTVGSGTLTDRVLLHWDGATFSRAPALPPDVYPKHVHSSGAGDVWITAGALNRVSDRVFKFDGAQWVEHRPGFANFSANVVWAESPTNVWLFGGSTEGRSVNQVWRYDGSTWREAANTLGFGVSKAWVVNSVAYALSGTNLFRIDATGAHSETAPAPLSSSAHVSAHNGVMYLVTGSRGSDAVYRRADPSAPWVPTTVMLVGDYRPPTVVAAGPSRAILRNHYGDIVQVRALNTASPTVVQETSTDLPRLRSFVGRRASPTAALTLSTMQAEGARAFVRSDANTTWSTASFAGATTLRHIEYTSDGVARFAVTESGAVLRFESERLVATSITSGVEYVYAQSTDRAVAVGGNVVRVWDGASWTQLPPFPARAGSLDLNQVRLHAAWMNREDIFVGGGVSNAVFEGDEDGVLCRYRANAWTCRTVASGQVGPSSVLQLAFGADRLWSIAGPLYSGGRPLFQVDLETLDSTRATINGAPQGFTRFRVNERTGAIALLSDRVFALDPATQRGEAYEVPLSGYYSNAVDVHLGDDGTVWLLREFAEILRLRVR